MPFLLPNQQRQSTEGKWALNKAVHNFSRQWASLKSILSTHWAVIFTFHTLKTTTLQPFNGLFSRTTWVSQYQKGKTNLDFTGARDSEWQWHQLGHMQVCTSLQTDNHIITVPHHSVSYRPDALPAAQPTTSKHWRHISHTENWQIKPKLLIHPFNGLFMGQPG